MNTTITPALATYYDVLHSERYTGMFFTGDNGVLFEVLATADNPANVGPLVRASRTRTLGRLVQTGTKITRGQVRARLEFAVDTGDVEGTLEFGTGEVLHGLTRAEVFEQ